MNIDKMTIGEFKELSALFKTESSHPFEVGRDYFIRTVTNYYTGKLKSVYQSELVLTECSWIPDTGRFSESLDNGFSEVEPFNTEYVIISRGSIIDMTPMKITLPSVVK